MRTYGSIQTCFWANTEAQQLSDQGKLLATYLLTGPHTNMIGCFRLPPGYIAEDLNWDIAKVKTAFIELSELSFIVRDEASGWLIINDFLKWNPIQNPKQSKGIQNLFETIPNQSKVFKPLIQNLINYGKYFEEGFRDRLHTHEKNMPANKEQDQDKNQDQKKLSSLREDVVRQTVFDSQQSTTCPHEKIITLYHDILPMCSPVRVWNKTRRSYLKQRWSENSKHQTLEWWAKYFEHVKQSQFLTGKVVGRDGKPPFIVDLEWLIRPNNFAKVIEGKYHGVRV